MLFFIVHMWYTKSIPHFFFIGKENLLIISTHGVHIVDNTDTRKNLAKEEHHNQVGNHP